MENTAHRAPSRVEQVCDQLAVLIQRQAGQPDSTLPPERRLAEQLGVSRTVVREAIQRLELQGLVEVRQGSGIRIVDKLHRPLISSLSFLVPDVTDRLRQLQETRLAIEPDAARLAALRATPKQLTDLEAIHARLEEAENNDHAITADLEFHRAVAEVSGNLMFRLILDSLAEIGFESRRRTIGRTGRELAASHHADILAAIAKRDPQAAADAMRLHLLTASRDMGLTSTPDAPDA